MGDDLRAAIEEIRRLEREATSGEWAWPHVSEPFGDHAGSATREMSGDAVALWRGRVMRAREVMRQPKTWATARALEVLFRIAFWCLSRARLISGASSCSIEVSSARPEDAVRDLYPEHRHAERGDG